MEKPPQLNVPDGFEWDSKPKIPLNKRKKICITPSAEEQKVSDIQAEENFLQQCRSKVKEFDPISTKYEEPKSLDQVQTLIMTYPNSSKAWILYMVYYLKQAEAEKARHIAKKAIQTINFRDEKEKFNMWIALLNLETQYGTNESFNKAFHEALGQNDQKKIFNHVIDAYMSAKKIKELEEFSEIMLKKFKRDKDVWIKIIQYYMESERTEEARKLLTRSHQSLDKKDYTDVMGKFAYLEYKYGELERAMGMFEDILDKYPKRKDLRSIYVNILKEHGYHDRINVLKTL